MTGNFNASGNEVIGNAACGAIARRSRTASLARLRQYSTQWRCRHRYHNTGEQTRHQNGGLQSPEVQSLVRHGQSGTQVHKMTASTTSTSYAGANGKIRMMAGGGDGSSTNMMVLDSWLGW